MDRGEFQEMYRWWSLGWGGGDQEKKWEERRERRNCLIEVLSYPRNPPTFSSLGLPFLNTPSFCLPESDPFLLT